MSNKEYNLDYIKDNFFYPKDVFLNTYPKISEKLLDKNLKYFAESKNNSLLLFPDTIRDSDDLEYNSKILETVDNEIKTGNVIGFIGCGKEKLAIHSRFSVKSDKEDYFLHYMLQKVLNINIVNLDTNMSLEEKIYDFFVLFFSKYLNDAMKKGLFKKYKYFEYNDANVKGRIDINRHLKTNIPFNYKIAYSNREFSYDHELTQLIRHTIEFIRASKGNAFLQLDMTEKENIDKIIAVTPSYKLGDRRKIISVNKTKTISHAYYTDYRKLQDLCLKILTFQKHNIGKDGENIYGILFDVAWLWEEYINTILPDDKYVHSENRKSKNGVSVYSDRVKNVYPDFYSKDGKLVLDAKYKIRYDKTKKSIPIEDLYQLISYSYILKTEKSGIIYPSTKNEKNYGKTIIGTLNGYGAELFKFGLKIPQKVESYKDFKFEIEKSEKIFIDVTSRL